MRKLRMTKGVLKRWFQTGISAACLCVLAVASAGAETISTASLKKAYPAAELDQMLAPVALYPDALLLQVLMASTHPADVLKAARWLDANPGPDSQAASDAADSFGWDVSIESLLAFPDVLHSMSSNMEWTVKLGTAFKTQRQDVMERVQHLRRQARAAGNLQSDERMQVVRTGNNIVIQPVSQEVIFVPYYNPAVVYGSWRWPGHAPYHWAPWRGYAAYPGYHSVGFMWGNGIWFSYTRFFGRMDWHRRHVHWNPPPRRHANGHPPPPRRSAPVHDRPVGKPRPDASHAAPVGRPWKNAHNQVRPGMRSGEKGANPARPGHDRSSAAVTSRPGQRPGAAAAANRPAPRRDADARPLRNRPDTPRQAARQPAGMQQARAPERAASRHEGREPASASRPSGPPISSSRSSHGNGQKGAERT